MTLKICDSCRKRWSTICGTFRIFEQHLGSGFRQSWIPVLTLPLHRCLTLVIWRFPLSLIFLIYDMMIMWPDHKIVVGHQAACLVLGAIQETWTPFFPSYHPSLLPSFLDKLNTSMCLKSFPLQLSLRGGVGIFDFGGSLSMQRVGWSGLSIVYCLF